MLEIIKLEVDLASKREKVELPAKMLKGLDIIEELLMLGYQATPCYQSLLIMASQFSSVSDWHHLICDELANSPKEQLQFLKTWVVHKNGDIK